MSIASSRVLRHRRRARLDREVERVRAGLRDGDRVPVECPRGSGCGVRPGEFAPASDDVALLKSELERMGYLTAWLEREPMPCIRVSLPDSVPAADVKAETVRPIPEKP